jgi:hypothetical protein
MLQFVPDFPEAIRDCDKVLALILQEGHLQVRNPVFSGQWQHAVATTSTTSTEPPPRAISGLIIREVPDYSRKESFKESEAGLLCYERLGHFDTGSGAGDLSSEKFDDLIKISKVETIVLI